MAGSQEILLSSLEKTRAQAKTLAETLRGGETIAFSGELGAGKTTFIRYLCAALGAEIEATSPSYVLQHEYTTTRGLLIEHWDLYRLKELPPELEEAVDSHTIRLIEWAERFPQLLSSASMLVELQLESETSRKMKITST